MLKHFFEINQYQDIELLVVLQFQKIILYNKFINKTQNSENQENSIHCFVDIYLINHLVKFL